MYIRHMIFAKDMNKRFAILFEFYNFFFYYQSFQKTASKFCEPTGKWYVSNETGRTWTNYTQCWPQYDSGNFLIEFEPNKNITTNNYAWLPIMKAISHVGYWCSLLTLLAAMSIFLFIK